MVKRDGNPYVSFKNDRDRLWALVSRDLRIIIVTALCAYAGLSPPARAMIQNLIA
jgi:hypothetical protein